MKELILTITISMFILSLQAQVTLDKTYNFSASIVKLETHGYKYFLMDVPNSECRIYNQDHSLFKTIECSVPAGFYLADIKYISESLFDNDSEIELVYTYYRYVPTQNSSYYEYDSKIINEDGSEIHTIDHARYVYVYQTDENDYKLFAYCYDYSVFPEIVWTNIYSISGTPVWAGLLENNSSEITLKAFPNPASETVKVAYSLPENVKTGKLFLFDNNGRIVNQYEIDKHLDYLSLDVTRFTSGVYHYFIEYGNSKTPSKKLVIQ